MYGDEDGALIAIVDTDDLLHRTAVVHAHQTAEDTHTVVHMHDIVARVELLYLLERHSHLTTTHLFVAQRVLVEAVEYLMVGEEAQLALVVAETGVKGAAHGSEADARLLVVEDALQAVGLLLGISQDVKVVALAVEALESGDKQVEILVEDGLRRDVEGNGCVLCCGGAHHHAAETAVVAPDRLLVDKRHIVGEIVEKRGCGLPVACKFGYDGDFLLLLDGGLLLYVERADAVHLVAEEVDAIGIFGGVTVNVNQRTANGVLTGFVNIIHTMETVFLQRLPDEFLVHLHPHGYGQRVALELCGRRHRLVESLRMRHHVERGTPPGNQPGKHLRAQYLTG